MKNDERPTIELYMYSLNQEFPVGKGHTTYLKRHSELKPDLRGELTLNASVESQVYQLPGNVSAAVPNDWSVQWLSNEWIQNHTKAAGVGTREHFDPLRNLIVREEDFGAIAFEPTTDRVYKLNRSGFKLLTRIIEAKRSGRLDGTRGLGSDDEQVIGFMGAMRAAGLLES